MPHHRHAIPCHPLCRSTLRATTPSKPNTMSLSMPNTMSLPMGHGLSHAPGLGCGAAAGAAAPSGQVAEEVGQ